MVFESKSLHFFGRQEVATIEYGRPRHDVLNSLPIQTSKLVPIRGNDESVGLLRGVVGVHSTNQSWLDTACLVHSLGIVGTDTGACGDESSVEVHSRGASDVVGACLVREAEQSDAFSFQHPHRALDSFKELIDPFAIDTLRRVGNSCLDTQVLSESTESAEVRGKAQAAEAESWAEKEGANSLIETDGVGHFLNISAKALAKVGQDVGVGDFDGKISVRDLLNQFGALNLGDKKLGSGAGGTCLVHRARESFIQERAISFTQNPFGIAIFNAQKNPVGVKEVTDGGSFAKEMGIRGNRKGHIAFAPVNGEEVPKLFSGLDWNGAADDDQLGGIHSLGKAPSGVVEGRKVRVAIFELRDTDAEKDSIGVIAGVCGVGGESECSGGPPLLKQLIEMGLVDRKLTCFEEGHNLGTRVEAHDAMPDRSQANACDQAYVLAAYNCDSHTGEP